MKRILKFVFAILLLPLLFSIFKTSGINVNAKENRVIRVGWFESPYNHTDEFGRRSGYSYEYQQRLSVYTGWEYEYVYGSWSKLLEELIDGKIDLLSDISYTDERATKMKYSSLPMGTEDYYLYKAPDNKVISVDDYSTFNGKKVGINKGSIMIDEFNNWAALNKVDAEVVELMDSVDEALAKLYHGDIDMYVSLDGYFDSETATPLCKVGSSDFYFAVKNDEDGIVDELNTAMSKLFNENPYYNQELHTRHFKTSGINRYFTDEEISWLESHKKVRVGYQDNYLAFCAKNPNTGELTGALKDYLNYASDSINNYHIDFEPVSYPSASAAIEAVKNGEVDCMFPANLSVYDGEINGLFMTTPFMKTDIVAIVLESEQKSFIKKEHVLVAVNAGNTNYDMFLADNFPDWQAVYFQDTLTGLKGISEGKADCLLMSNYRFNNVALKCKDYNLVYLSTGVQIDYCFAVKRNNSALYSILNKIINVVPESSVNASLTYYYTEDSKISVGDMITQNLGIIMVVLAIIAILILFLILRNVWIEKRSKSRQLLIKATETDDKTKLYNKIYFLEYANRIYRENPDKPMDAIAINIEHFH